MCHLTSSSRVLVAGSILAVLTLQGAALAAPLVYEGFDYLPGMPLPGMPGGTGWGAPWIGSGLMVAAPPTLQYPAALPPSGIALDNTAVGEAFRPFGPALDNIANELWISFMEETLAAAGGAFVSLDPVSPSFPTIIVSKDGGGTVVLGGVGPPIFAGASAGVGNVDFFVLRLHRFTGVSTTVDLYLDPGVSFGVPSASFTVPSPFFIAQFYYRSDPQQELDEIRVGTLPTDVAAASRTGDTNCDGLVNAFDIDPFVLALTDPAAYMEAYPTCNILNADCNGDGLVNAFDIDPFVALLTGG